MVIKNLLKVIKKYINLIKNFNILKMKQEIDILYMLLYKLTHSLEDSIDVSAIQTKNAFENQWKNIKEGKYLLSDLWFKENVARILYEEEIQIKKEWFRGKNILDAGCGNGRWSYGFAQLGANITAVDINEVAIDETRKAIKDFKVKKEFYVSPLENLSNVIPFRKYDLVFCWGVLHHSKNFNKSLKEVIKFVKNGGILYIYLYGRESSSYNDDLEIFKERVKFNTLISEQEKYNFLLKKARGNRDIIHNLHDCYAPLINRRLDFDYVKNFLKYEEFEDIVRTIEHTELFIRAIKSNTKDYYRKWILPKKQSPYWFTHHKFYLI